MKNLFYFIIALVSLTSCTIDQEDIPQPTDIQEDYKVEPWTGNPEYLDELPVVIGNGATTDLTQEEEEQPLSERDNTRFNHDFPEASLQSVKGGKIKEHKVSGSVATFPENISEVAPKDINQVKKGNTMEVRISGKKLPL